MYFEQAILLVQHNGALGHPHLNEKILSGPEVLASATRKTNNKIKMQELQSNH